MSRPVGKIVDVEPLELWEYTLIMGKLPTHWQLFYELLWNTGFRLTEALDLTKKDLDETGVWVTRKKRKDKLREHLPLKQDLMSRLQERCHYSRSAHIFDYTPQAAWFALHTAVKLAGVRGTIHPHLFRHGLGHRLDRAGVPTNVIQRMLGHVNISSTFRYTKATKSDVDEIWRKQNK